MYICYAKCCQSGDVVKSPTSLAGDVGVEYTYTVEFCLLPWLLLLLSKFLWILPLLNKLKPRSFLN